MLRFVLLVSCFVTAIDASAFSTDTTIVKGSYLFYAPPTIEDNSMFIDEALNQNSGSIQFVSSLVIEQESSAYQLDIEVPLAGEKHQLSFSLPVTLRSFRRTNDKFFSKVGNFQITYRPLLLGKSRWCLLAPAFTLILPTENLNNTFSANGFGAETKIALTKRLGQKITTHLNFGGLLVMKRQSNEHSDFSSNPSEPVNQSTSLGTGLVWAMTRSINLMLEQVYTRTLVQNSSTNSKLYNEMTISPAVRFALNVGKHQVVPAIGFPLNFSTGAFNGCNAFFYLSIETDN